ncbi:MAG: oligosaccharide flippase family protein [Clostridia bacterium]|nr:oligosaccharide flippase family protein [Clostridia bacterium]
MNALLARWRALPASAKASAAFIISSLVLKGMSFLTTPIFTRIMDTSQYGVISLYNSWLLIIEVFALLGLNSAGVFNVGLNDYKDSRDQYISSVLTLCNLATVVVFAGLFIAKGYLGEDFLLPTNLLILMFIHLLFNPAQVFWITRQRYEYKYKLAFTLTVGTAVLSQILSIVFVYFNQNTPDGYVKLWSTEIGSLFVYIPLYFLLFFRGKTFVDPKRWKQILVFALPLLPHYLAQHVMSGSDRIMVAELVSEADAGIYSVVAQISLVANIVWNAINASLIAYTHEHLEKKEYKKINSTVTLLIFGFGVICLGICLIAPEVLKILAPEEYYVGVYAIPPIAGVAFLAALYNVFANLEFFHKKSFYITLSTIVATVINLALNFVFIPKFSFYAASYTTLASYIVLVIMHYIGYRRCCKEKIYNGKVLLLIMVGFLAAFIGCSLLYVNTIVRYAFIAALILVVLWKHRFIINEIKKLRNK